MKKNKYTDYFLQQKPEQVRKITNFMYDLTQHMSIWDLEIAIKLYENRDTESLLHEIIKFKKKNEKKAIR